MSLAIDVPTLTQCENVTITWSSTNVNDKTFQVFVQGNKYFSEKIQNIDITGSLGSFSWLCDFPAGAALGVEVHNGNGSIYDVGYETVQPGSTDACLRQNPGQLATASMAALASSLSSASPQLFTYASTATSTSTASSETITSSPASSISSPSATLVPAPPLSSGNNLGIIIGGVVGGVALLAAAALLLYFFLRRRRPGTTSDGSQEKEPTTGGTRSAAEAGAGGGILSALSARQRSSSFSNPIQAWRGRIASGRPPSGYSAASPVDVDAPRFGSLGGMGISAAGGSLSAGPRVGVPEVYDGGDHSAFGGHGAYGAAGVGFGVGSAQGIHSTSSNGGAYDPLPSPSEFVLPNSLRYPPTLPPQGYLQTVAEHEPQAMPFARLDQRPPTRLTTPGAVSSWNGDGSTESARELPYQSYTRG